MSNEPYRTTESLVWCIENACSVLCRLNDTTRRHFALGYNQDNHQAVSQLNFFPVLVSVRQGCETSIKVAARRKAPTAFGRVNTDIAYLNCICSCSFVLCTERLKSVYNRKSCVSVCLISEASWRISMKFGVFKVVS